MTVKEVLAQRKVLDDLMYDMLLPDAIRNPIRQEMYDEYIGISELFGEEEKKE